jgi:hypothetical protein
MKQFIITWLIAQQVGQQQQLNEIKCYDGEEEEAVRMNPHGKSTLDPSLEKQRETENEEAKERRKKKASSNMSLGGRS